MTEEAEGRRDESEASGDPVYKTKVVQFLGRTTPIVLQNENGPCPLLAICNVLLLRNIINLSVDEPEVTQQKLLSLVAERLIDSNSNVQDKDDAYVNNQQQNISDAIDLLPRLSTGIDVNVLFRKINDFEFTRECAIFDLLDIALYHGWIVDPQDIETASVIGSKSYNTLVAEYVTRRSEQEETKLTKSEQEVNQDEEGQTVDFAAACTATLGVPSPSLSRGLSFEDFPVPPVIPSADEQKRRGDIEEEEELKRILDLSKSEILDQVIDSSVISPVSEENAKVENSELVAPKNESTPDATEKPDETPLFEMKTENSALSEPELALPHKKEDKTDLVESAPEGVENSEGVTFPRYSSDNISLDVNQFMAGNTGEQLVGTTGEEHDSVGTVPAEVKDNYLDGPDVVDNEPMYQGEEHILNSRSMVYESPEPVYEGEVLLAEKANKEASPHESGGEPEDHQWQLIKQFLENNASQLTIYGLFCLQDGLKERELCVFFRNNHFSTMFKYNGELYLLATDQGYINQPDLVWEKLNEVNGDTVFMTGNFTQFKVENRGSESWNEQQAMTSTADYLATLGTPSLSVANSDLQLAIALQQQEFEQQQQQQPQQQQQQPQQQQQQQPQQQQQQRQQQQQLPYPQRPPGSSSRLIVGPQRSGASNVQQRPSESKLKEKCTIM